MRAEDQASWSSANCSAHRRDLRIIRRRAKDGAPGRLINLYRMMHHIAREQRNFAARCHTDGPVIDAVTGCGMQHEAVNESNRSGLDQPRLSGRNDRLHAILEEAAGSAPARNSASRASYSIPENTYWALRKVGTHRPSTSCVFQPT